MAAVDCPYCQEPIGYDKRFYCEGDDPIHDLCHAFCLEEDIERVRREQGRGAAMTGPRNIAKRNITTHTASANVAGTPHTEPETLAAWARRTAPTLVDQQWRVIVGRQASEAELDAFALDFPGPSYAAAKAALLAELDRIAGELSPGGRTQVVALGDVESVPWLKRPITFDRLERAGLVHESQGWAFLTPLGRAVLARAGSR